MSKEIIQESALSETILDHEPSCQSTQHMGDCLTEVSHFYRSVCLNKRKLVCANAAAYVVDRSRIHNLCADCGQPCSECWTVVPV